MIHVYFYVKGLFGGFHKIDNLTIIEENMTIEKIFQRIPYPIKYIFEIIRIESWEEHWSDLVQKGLPYDIYFESKIAIKNGTNLAIKIDYIEM